jgi:DNA-binding NtrC family response regulator
MTDYVSKPIDVDQLHGAIRRACAAAADHEAAVPERRVG